MSTSRVPSSLASRGSHENPSASFSWPEVPGYEVLEEVGRGGMGIVYKSRHLISARLVALKLLLTRGSVSPKERKRFRLEAEVLTRLEHPNIVAVHEVGEHNGWQFLCLELIEGGSLAQRLRGGVLPADEAAKLVQTLARTMHDLHRAGIIHGDLKPANVLLARRRSSLASSGRAETKQGCFVYEPKIADFGMATVLDREGMLDHDGEILGTPAYVAPEQAAGRLGGKPSPAIDVYALGATLYELLTGRPPFCAETPLATLLQALEQEPIPPRALRSSIPVGLEMICLKCLNKRPHQRYDSALELADDLCR